MSSTKRRVLALTGAKQNAGDFLITSRCLALLEHVCPEVDFLVHPSEDEISDAVLESTAGIVIMGGPGYQPQMYPNIYRLSDGVFDRSIPVFPVGLGWKGAWADPLGLESYRFSASSNRFLSFASGFAPLSCRDFYTHHLLHNLGHDVIMTGCPAWYDLDAMDRSFSMPSSLDRIAYSLPASAHFIPQAVALARILKDRFPKAVFYGCMHQGLAASNKRYSSSFITKQEQLASQLRGLGFEIVDMAHSADSFSVYDEVDLHMGYRVHAHIYRISHRLPSMLFYEDARGNGVDQALGLQGVPAYQQRYRAKHPMLVKGLKQLVPSKSDEVFLKEVAFLLDTHLSTSFLPMHTIKQTLDVYFGNMKSHLQLLNTL